MPRSFFKTMRFPWICYCRAVVPSAHWGGMTPCIHTWMTVFTHRIRRSLCVARISFLVTWLAGNCTFVSVLCFKIWDIRTGFPSQQPRLKMLKASHLDLAWWRPCSMNVQPVFFSLCGSLTCETFSSRWMKSFSPWLQGMGSSTKSSSLYFQNEKNIGRSMLCALHILLWLSLVM